MTRQSAFSLLEVVIYLSLFSVVVLILGRFALDTRVFMTTLDKSLEHTVQEHLFLDVLRRDLVSASPYEKEWGKHDFVFRKRMVDNQGIMFFSDIGYVVKKQALLRFEGRYDFAAASWINKTTSLLFNGIASLDHVLRLEETGVRGVCVSYRLAHDKEKQFFTRVRNGTVVR